MRTGVSMSRPFSHLLLWVLMFPFCLSATAADGETLVLTSAQKNYPLNRYVQIFEDRSNLLTAEDIVTADFAFVPLGKPNETMGNKGSTFWVKVPVINRSDLQQWVVEYSNSHYSYFDLYYFAKGKLMRSETGGAKEFSQRKLPYEFLLHDLHLEKDQSYTLYFRMKSETPANLRLSMHSYDAFIGKISAHQYLVGMYYGLIAMLFIYSIFNFLMLKNKAYLNYGLYIFSVGLMLFTFDGKASRYLWGNYPGASVYLMDSIIMLVLFFGFNYASHFLNTRLYSPLSDKLYKIFMVVALVLAISIPILPVNAGLVLAQDLPIPGMIFIIITSVIAYRKGNKRAIIFFIAFLLFSIGAAISNLVWATIIPASNLTLHSIHIGSAAEALILLFGISRQMTDLKKQSEQAQLQVISQLQETEKLQAEANRQLEVKVQERTAEIYRRNLEIEEKNKSITDSIQYAKRIQDAILPKQDYLQKLFPEHYIFFRPKDIVSGDFYWAAEKDGYRVVAAIDCTGHGVPGAFMSMIGNSLLNEIVLEKGITDPGKILDLMAQGVKKALQQTGESSGSKDGMDVAICTISAEKKQLFYAGANNPLWIARSTGDGSVEFEEVKPDKQPIGFYLNEQPFRTHSLSVEGGERFFIFSDGYADQFGGPSGKKFKYRPLKQLLTDIFHEKPETQKVKLEATFDSWKGELEQVDDVLLISFSMN